MLSDNLANYIIYQTKKMHNYDGMELYEKNYRGNKLIFMFRRGSSFKIKVEMSSLEMAEVVYNLKIDKFQEEYVGFDEFRTRFEEYTSGVLSQSESIADIDSMIDRIIKDIQSSKIPGMNAKPKKEETVLLEAPVNEIKKTPEEKQFEEEIVEAELISEEMEKETA